MDPQTATQTLAALISNSNPQSNSTRANQLDSANQPLPVATRRISLTPFDKRVYTLLLQIPPGSFTTYSLLSKSLNSSPRAVGNSCRRNPFAPTVPCHRVVATGGSLGGFKGEHLSKIVKKTTASSDKEISRTTKKTLFTLDQKRNLLKKEGVRFDPTGQKVLGTPYAGFQCTI
ncbi:6-O-methylguanine DNA methyltransferase [Rhypophila decipiens]|uniref:Methylated-DNA--protein-cysteine methyltransferase n=1 Tax=Rhypophila decipiens TaxID=261697 RepID=A0AAN6Y6S4_9PEZI|nr:6-O-methylguanine DNA methyltransferase [Rhypophila decipiens]